ncbi:MAG: YadA-like family protein [Acidaminococcaceae bacterium]|nr:YadA-like family protein [Acidaminococcaceae bacterium]
MNKIYKLIWSKAKNCYVVASELAKSHTKSNGARSARSLTARAACGIVLGAFLAVGYSMPSASALSIGDYVKFDENNWTLNLGYLAKSELGADEGVALGNNSLANRGMYSYDAYLFDGKDRNAPEWVASHGAVSIGNDNPGGGNRAYTRQIIGVAAGSADSDAVNVAQLKVVAASTEIKDKHNYYDGSSTAVKVTDAVNAVDKALGKVAAGNYITVYDAKAGVGTFADNLKALDDAIGQNASEISALKAQDGQIAPEGETKSDEFVKGDTVYDYLNSDSLSFGDNSTKIAIGKGSKVMGKQSIAIGFGNKVSGNNSGAFGDPNTITGDGSYAVGNNNTIGGNNTFVLGNNVTANVDNAVVLGNKSTAEANAVSVGSEGGERQIKHVAAGTDDTDAVNVSQLKALEQNTAGDLNVVNNRISSMDNKINKVGAGAAALAALHPIDTDDKFSMGLGYGNYRDAHAMAMGLFYRPTEKIMFSVGGSMGNGENMINAGVTFALDKGKGFGTSKAAMARKINELTKENAAQATKIETLEARLAAIEAKLEK